MTDHQPKTETEPATESQLGGLSGGTNRRQLLQFLGAASLAAIGGCSAASDSESTPESATPTEGTSGDTQTVTATPDESKDSAASSEVDLMADEATVEMVTSDDAFIFSPRVVCIKPGGTVNWKSTNGVHTASAYHPDTGKPLRIPGEAKSFDSGLIPEGESYSHTFEEPGVYNYYCMPHETNGMVGAVVVGDPSTANQPGLETPQDVLSSQTTEVLNDIMSEVETQLNLPVVTDVSMRTTSSGYTFTPKQAQVRRGGTIRWTTVSGVHTATAYHPSNGEPQRVPDGTRAWSSEPIKEGQTYNVSLQREGVYDYYCMPHEGNGMVGSIIIGDPTTENEPGLAEPQDVIPESSRVKLTTLNEQAREELNASDDTDSSENGSSELPDPNPDGYLDDALNFDSEGVDKTGQDSVTIDVGASGDMGNYAFGPAAVYVDPGTTVTWKWTGKGGKHSVVAEDDSFESTLTETTDHTFEHTFESAGTHNYYCAPHRTMGMKGAVVVTDGGSSGSGDSSDQGSGSSDSPTTKQDSATNYKFSPAVIHIEPGDTVEWEMDKGMHSITAYHPDNNQPQRIPDAAESFDSGMLEEGKTYSHTFENEGVYDYYCTPHHAMGMVGTVVVGSPSDGEPGLAAPQSSIPSKAASELETLNEQAKSQE